MLLFFLLLFSMSHHGKRIFAFLCFGIESLLLPEFIYIYTAFPSVTESDRERGEYKEGKKPVNCSNLPINAINLLFYYFMWLLLSFRCICVCAYAVAISNVVVNIVKEFLNCIQSKINTTKEIKDTGQADQNDTSIWNIILRKLLLLSLVLFSIE